MVARTILATLAGSAPHQRVQVSLAQGRDGTLELDLCEQHYAEGIGWFDQRSLALDPRQLRQLSAVLNLKSSTLAEAERACDVPATLPFPGPSQGAPRRTAVGDGR